MITDNEVSVFVNTRDIIDQYVIEHYGKQSYLEMVDCLRRDYHIDVNEHRICLRVTSLRKYGAITERVTVPVKEARTRNEHIRRKEKLHAKKENRPSKALDQDEHPGLP